MIREIGHLFSRRLPFANRLPITRPRRSRRADSCSLEQLEMRRVFATYQLDQVFFDSTPITGWPVIGTGDLTLQFKDPFSSSQNLGLTFTSPSNANVQVTLSTTNGSVNAVAGITPGLFNPLWNGTAFNATLGIVNNNLTGNASLAINPTNITSINSSSTTVNASANLTLLASDPAHGFGNLSSHSFFLVEGQNYVSASLVGNASNSTQLTINIPQGVLNATGNYTLQTTPSGARPANAVDTANFALSGNLAFAVTAVNYTIASVAYKSQPISGWSWVGSGNETISITLANGSTHFAENQLVWFGNTSKNGVRTSHLTLDVAVPSLPAYVGTPTYQNLSFGVVSNTNTTNGGFLYSNIALSGPSNSNSYVSGGGSLTLTADSVPFGFNPSENLTVVFDDGNLANKKSTNSTPPTNSTSLTVNLPAFAATGNYSVFIQSTGNGNPQASSLLNLTVLPNPSIGNLTITFKDDTGLNSSTQPPLNSLYAYVYGTVTGGAGFFDINASTGVVGNSPTTSANGTPFTTLTGNGAHNAALFFNLADTVYNGTRVYLSSESTLSDQPTANLSLTYYDYIELSASGGVVTADTSQVDQFGMPFTLNLSLNTAGNQSKTSGISPGLTRQDIIEGYSAAFQNVPGYNLAVVPTGGLGNQTLQTYRVLAPNDLLNSLTGGASQQGDWTYAITPQNSPLPGPSGNYTHWAWLNVTNSNVTINGALYPQGSPVTGPWIPAGTVIAETNLSATVTSFKIGTYDSGLFQNRTVDAIDNGGVRIQQLTANMTTAGYQSLMNTFGPSVYNGNGTDPWSNLTLLNQDNAIDRLFKRFQNDTFWWQEENQPKDPLKDTNKYPKNVALYRGEVTSVTQTSIDGSSANYAVLNFVDYTNGTPNPNLSFAIYYPYFTTNSPANKRDPFNNPVPAPPSWYGQNQANFDAPSLSVFGGAGVFQPGAYMGEPTFEDAYNDLGRDVAVALSRGYASTFLSTSEPINNLSNPNLPVFQYSNVDNTAGNWTMPTTVYDSLGGKVTSGMVVSSFVSFDSPMTVTGVATAGSNTVVSVVPYAPGMPFIKPGSDRDNLQFVTFADSNSRYPSSNNPIPFNLYESFIQSRGDFANGVSNGTGSEKVNIDGLGYGYAFSDFMGLSSTIEVKADTAPDAAATQTANLLVTMQPWFNSAPIDVSYDIQSVAFGVQNISGWSLFGSGTDTISITTTGNSTPFTTSDTYNLSFGNTTATATAVSNHTLNVAVPSLVSRWAGNGTSFANLTISGGNTTGNTSFAVLPVILTGVTPNNGPVTGGTNITTLTALDKQHGFGNATNVPVGFVLNGASKPGLTVVTSNATSLSLVSPSSPDHAAGNAAIGIYTSGGLSSLASNNLTFTYTVTTVSYDIQSVAFGVQNISGWSLFGSGTDTISITTTGNSTPFTTSDTYNLSFGNTTATATAVSNHTLNVAVPSLVSRWAGNGTSFANLTISGGNTTGNTSFAVLPVILTGVTPNNGPVTGGTNITTLTALDKQHGFGNATNLRIGFSGYGLTAAAVNVVVGNATAVSLLTPSVGTPGSWSIGAYASSDLTPANLASNNLPFTYVADGNATIVSVPISFMTTAGAASKLVWLMAPFTDRNSPRLIATVSVSPADGTLRAMSRAGVIVTPSGTPTTALTFTGTRAALNAYFQNSAGLIRYTPTAAILTPRTLTVHAQGSDRLGGLATTSLLVRAAAQQNPAPAVRPTALLTGSTGQPVVITYAQLVAASGATQTTSRSIQFMFAGLNAGRLEYWTGSRWLVVPSRANVPLVAPGGQIRWTPPVGASGARAAFSVKTWDGWKMSGVSAVSVNLTR